MYTQGTDYTTGATTSTNYTTSQYQYQYQYQMPTTTTTTTTQQYTTTTPVTYSTQQYAVPEFTQTYTTTAVPTTVTTSIPTTVTTSVPTYTTTIPSTVTTTTSVPTYTTTQYTTTSASQYASPVLPAPVKPQPAFQLLRQGSGISPHEQQAIVTTSMAVYMSGISPISNNTAARIKKTLGGDWIVIVYEQGKPVDFNMTCVQGNDYMYFTLDNTAYQVCRLR